VRALFRKYWTAAPLATALLVLALVVAGVFGIRTALFYSRWNDPALRDQPVAAWMTPGFIGHAYHIPRADMIEALQLPVPPPETRMTLKDIADHRGVPVDTVLDEARALVAEARARQDEGRQ